MNPLLNLKVSITKGAMMLTIMYYNLVILESCTIGTKSGIGDVPRIS